MTPEDLKTEGLDPSRVHIVVLLGVCAHAKKLVHLCDNLIQAT